MFKLIVNGKNGREVSDNFKTREEAQAHYQKHLSEGHWSIEDSHSIDDITAEYEAEKLKQETKINDRVSRVDQLKKIDWNQVVSTADLKAIVKAIVKEITKDDE